MRLNTFGIACSSLLMAASAFAALPKATALVEPMGMGYNIGNTMEVPENPTAWGNPLPTAGYIKAIKAAGFNTVRIPCAWYSQRHRRKRRYRRQRQLHPRRQGRRLYHPDH